MVVGILGVCFVTIIGLLGYLWWVNKPLVLEGTLEGEVVSATTLRPATVDVTSIDQPTRKSVLDALRELPYSLKSSLVVTEFRSRSDALEVRLVPTTTTTVVRVSPKEDPQLAAWVAEQQTVLATRRQTELLEATQRFFDDYSAYRADGTRMGDGGYYRNRLGLGATNVSLGYFVEAVASNQACPCVFEDSQGNLYFVVPRQTSSFTVRGRKLSDGTRLFPGTYTVDCSAIRESFEVVTPPTDPKADESKAGSDSEPTSSDQGDDKKPMMDPNSDNPDSEPTSSSSEEPPMMSGSM
ncbi:MAG: hypothetical protein AB8G99_12260 [Planctomycetaceae bacterium]